MDLVVENNLEHQKAVLREPDKVLETREDLEMGTRTKGGMEAETAAHRRFVLRSIVLKLKCRFLARTLLFTLIASDLIATPSSATAPRGSHLEIGLEARASIALTHTHFLALGQVPEGAEKQVVLTLINKSKTPVTVGVFQYGAMLNVRWVIPDPKVPESLKTLLPGIPVLIKATFVAHSADAQQLQAIVLTKKQQVLSRIIVHSTIRSKEYIDWDQKQYMASREGDAWGDYYPICSGPPPFGYAMDWGRTTFRVHEHWEGYGARNCDKGATLESNNNWTRCQTTQHNENGVCYEASIQGYKADCIGGDTGCTKRVVHAWEYLTSTWHLIQQEPDLR